MKRVTIRRSKMSRVSQLRPPLCSSPWSRKWRMNGTVPFDPPPSPHPPIHTTEKVQTRLRFVVLRRRGDTEIIVAAEICMLLSNKSGGITGSLTGLRRDIDPNWPVQLRARPLLLIYNLIQYPTYHERRLSPSSWLITIRFPLTLLLAFSYPANLSPEHHGQSESPRPVA